MKLLNRLLKSFYLFVVIYTLSESPCLANISIPHEIPDGNGQLLACLMAVTVIILKNSNALVLLKKVY